MVQDIPNSINNNKDKLELVSISKLKLRYNPQSLLTGKIFARISNFKEVPLYSFPNLARIWLSTMRGISSHWVSTTSTQRRLMRSWRRTLSSACYTLRQKSSISKASSTPPSKSLSPSSSESTTLGWQRKISVRQSYAMRPLKSDPFLKY